MWHVISPEVLSEAKGLSVGATGFFLFVGLMLWGFGWRWHKFWTAFTITLLAGLLGLTFGRAAGLPLLAVALGVAVVCGVLAMELAKILAFLTGGVAAWLGAQVVLPQAQELWAAFLFGGLIGVLLHQFWTMLATSFVGTVLVGHTVLLFLDQLGLVKDAEFAGQYAAAINGWAAVSTIVGVVVQAKTAKKDPAKVEETATEETDAKEPVKLPIRAAA
jgi:hypothetical protein